MTPKIDRAPNIERAKHPWYSFDKIYSYNCQFMAVVGGRGIGKTYGAKKKAIAKFLKTGEQFIYLRRFQKETSSSRMTFANAVSAEFPDYDMRVNGNEIEIAHVNTREDKKREWATCGFFASLILGQNYKGADFPNVTTIIFDEFIIERGSGARYIDDEVAALMNFYSTVDRYQGRTRVVMLANAVSVDNPYFMEWGVMPEAANKDGFVFPKVGQETKRFLAVHFPDSEDFKNSIYETEFGKFIQGTSYAEYAVENTFSDAGDSLVERKDPDAEYVFTLETRRHGFISVWHNPQSNELYAQRKRPGNERIFTLDLTRVNKGKRYLEYSSPKLNVMRSAFRRGEATFDHYKTRAAFMEVFKR